LKNRPPHTSITGADIAKPTHLNHSVIPKPKTHSPRMSGRVSAAPKMSVNFQAAMGESADGSPWQLGSWIGTAS
jgi:hypothetical protein